MEAFKAQASDKLDDLEVMVDRVKAETSDAGHRYLDDSLSSCKSAYRLSENEADRNVAALTGLTEEFIDFSDEYDRQVGACMHALHSLNVSFSFCAAFHEAGRFYKDGPVPLVSFVYMDIVFVCADALDSRGERDFSYSAHI